MFLCAYVQETVPRVHCYMSHFFSKLLDDGKYKGFGPQGTTSNSLNTQCDLTEEE